MLEKIKIGYSPLSRELYLYRHGKDKRLALSKRPCEHDVMAGIVEMMMDDAPKGSKKCVCFGDQCFEISVIPIPLEKYELRKRGNHEGE